MAEKQPKAVFIYTTVPEMKAAEAIGEMLVREKLAACVNVWPLIHSIYEWEGEIQYDEEAAMSVKTTPERADAAADKIAELHPYEVPAILRLPVWEVNQPYLDWLREQTAEEA